VCFVSDLKRTVAGPVNKLDQAKLGSIPWNCSLKPKCWLSIRRKYDPTSHNSTILLWLYTTMPSIMVLTHSCHIFDKFYDSIRCSCLNNVGTTSAPTQGLIVYLILSLSNRLIRSPPSALRSINNPISIRPYFPGIACRIFQYVV
jgi:hypothetical protein